MRVTATALTVLLAGCHAPALSIELTVPNEGALSANGASCLQPSAGGSTECSSGYCAKGPPSAPCTASTPKYYCMAANKSCPKPNLDGVGTGDLYSHENRTYYCLGSNDLRLADGAICEDANDTGLACASGNCFIGPWGTRYCSPSDANCTRPRDLSAPYGLPHGGTYAFDGGVWECNASGPGEPRIAPVCTAQGCRGVANGHTCFADRDCSSNRCLPGPGLDDQRYCAAANKNCPRPSSSYINASDDGVLFDANYSYVGHRWLCSSSAGRLVDLGPLDHLGYGAQSWPGADPIGGGPGYTSYIDANATDVVVVSTAVALRDAVQQANVNGGTVYVEGSAAINLSEIASDLPLMLQDNVTLASDRGKRGSLGALLYIDSNASHPGTQLFWTPPHLHRVLTLVGSHVRVTGLRLRGTDPRYRFVSACDPYEDGIFVQGPFASVDNCELSQWNYRALQAEGAGTQARIAHNHIHHSRRFGLGYGVNVIVTSNTFSSAGTTSIYANVFDWGRHAIAGGGVPGTRYRAAFNIVGEAFTHYPFDMHDGGGNPQAGGVAGIAGTSVAVSSNSFYDYNSLGAVGIGAPPEELSCVTRNHFNAFYRKAADANASLACYHPYGGGANSATMIDGNGSCAVSQYSSPNTRYSQFDNLVSVDNRHANDPATCALVACSEDWACGGGTCSDDACRCGPP